MSHSDEATILFSIAGVNAYQLRHGQQDSLTPTGPQTLNLTTSTSPPTPHSFSKSQADKTSPTLRLCLGPEVDILLLATTKIFRRPPRSYMIPPASFQDNVAAFTRIELPETVGEDDVETFETILTQCTGFSALAGTPRGTPRGTPKGTPRGTPRGTPAQGTPLGRSPTNDTPTKPTSTFGPPSRAMTTPTQQPSSLTPAQGTLLRRSPTQNMTKTTSTFGSPARALTTPTHRSSSLAPPSSRPGMDRKTTGQLVLVNEDDGSVMGELGAGAEVVEDPKLSHNQDTPVEISISADGTRVDVRNASDSESYLLASRDPRYADSSLVQGAAKASRLIVASSSKFGNFITSGAEKYTQTTKPTNNPVTFSPAAQETARKVHAVTKMGAQFTTKSVERLAGFTQNMVASLLEMSDEEDDDNSDEERDKTAGTMVRRGEQGQAQKKPAKSALPMPGWVQEGVAAISTVMDGLAVGTKTVFSDTGDAATTALSHKYGEEAGQMAASLGGGLRNVGLVYVDITGIPRKAVIRSLAKGVIVGRVKDATGEERDVVVGDVDGDNLDRNGDAKGKMKLLTDVDEDDIPPPTPPRRKSYDLENVRRRVEYQAKDVDA